MVRKRTTRQAKKTKIPHKNNKLERMPTAKSERVVVDEIFDNGTARILRAKRDAEANESDLSLDTWKEELEDFIDAWRVEAFVGFTSQRHLHEGDVFFIIDGSRLNNKYKPIPREKARSLHLLLPWEKSREYARQEIKKEFSKLL